MKTTLEYIINKRGLVASDIARAIGISKQRLNLYIRGANKIPESLIEPLSKALDVNRCLLQGEHNINREIEIDRLIIQELSSELENKKELLFKSK